MLSSFPTAPYCRVDKSGIRYWYLPSMTAIGDFTQQWKLPAGVSCDGGCVMQWWVAAGIEVMAIAHSSCCWPLYMKPVQMIGRLHHCLFT